MNVLSCCWDIKREGSRCCCGITVIKINTPLMSVFQSPWSLASIQSSPGPLGAARPSSRKNDPSKWPKRRTLSSGIVTDGRWKDTPTLTKMSDEGVRQSRLSPVRDLEQPRAVGFTVTGQTLERGAGSSEEQKSNIRTCVAFRCFSSF